MEHPSGECADVWLDEEADTDVEAEAEDVVARLGEVLVRWLLLVAEAGLRTGAGEVMVEDMTTTSMVLVMDWLVCGIGDVDLIAIGRKLYLVISSLYMSIPTHVCFELGAMITCLARM